MHWVALGIGCLAAALALFRRTGDLSRDIRLHRNMLLRPGLDRAARGEVERELAEDYRRGGMLAEAAQVLEPLARAGDAAALEALRDVRVEQGDLAAAAELQRRLGGERLLAHILAALSRQRGPAGGRGAAEDAVAACPASADALLALAEAAAAREPQVALSSVARALEAEPGAALLAWPALAAVGAAAGAGRVVEERIEKAPSDAALHLLRGRLLASQGRRPEALAAFARALELDSSGEVTLTMRELLRQADAPEAADLEARHDLAMAALLRPVRPPSCRRCGAAAAARSWRCPRCGSFDAYP